MLRAEEEDDEHKEDDSSEKDSLSSELEPVSRSDIKRLMTGMNMVAEDLKSMKEKQQQFEEILLGTTVPGKTPAKEVKSKAKVRRNKKDKEDRKSKSSKSKKSQDSSDSGSDDDDSSSSSSSSSLSEDGSDPDLDPDDLFAQAFGDKPGKTNKFQFVNPIRGSSSIPAKMYSKSDKKSRKSLMFSKETYSTAQMPHYTRMQPSFDHIKLEMLNAPSVIRFLQNLNEYQQKHRIILKAETLIDRRIINDLMADDNINDWNYGHFHLLVEVFSCETAEKMAY